MVFSQIQLVGLLLSVATAVYGQNNLNECRRGVKRAHPTQENAYQIFSRNGWRSQWIDQDCPTYQVFDQQSCSCIDGYVRPTTTTTTTTTPQPTTRLPPTVSTTQELGEEGPNCNFHQPHPNNPSMYARLTDNGWTTEDCNWPFYTGLVWDQETCRCEWGPEGIIPPRRVDGNQAAPKACLLMLNMTFDNAIVEESRGLWLKRTNPSNARIIQDHTARGGACALFQDSSLSVPYFKSNTLGKTFHISFRFRSCDNNPSGEITLLHNGCAEVTRVAPTIKVAFRPWSREFTMEFEAANDVAPTKEGCVINPQGNGWNDVDIRYQENYLEVTVNGGLCIGSNVFSGDIKTTDCPLTLPGSNACVHLDEMVVTRGCLE